MWHHKVLFTYLHSLARNYYLGRYKMRGLLIIPKLKSSSWICGTHTWTTHNEGASPVLLLLHLFTQENIIPISKFLFGSLSSLKNSNSVLSYSCTYFIYPSLWILITHSSSPNSAVVQGTTDKVFFLSADTDKHRYIPSFKSAYPINYCSAFLSQIF